MSHISLTNLSKRYGDEILAVDDVSIDIEEGEFLTLVGPSGCGKTTTLRMVAGLEQPSDGQIFIGGEDVTNRPPYKRNTGIVFQQFALFPHMTVAENIAYGLEVGGNHTEEEISERVDEMLELVQLPETANRNPSQLSGGQQQRVALARALAPEPEVLLLDEPLASLDKKLREQMQKELRIIQQKVNITTIFVTHNQTEAMTMSDRLVVMDDGHFEQVGAPAKVYDHPDSRFVAEFLGTSNIFEGTASREDGVSSINCGDLSITVDSDVSDGEAMTVVVRPENVQIRNAEEATTDEDNIVQGTIEFRRNLGSSVHYHIRTNNDREIVSISQRTGDNLEVGTEVTISISSDKCLVLPN